MREQLHSLINKRINKILRVAEAALPPKQFQAFRGITLDEFGKSGLGQDLDRLYGNRPQQER